MERRTFAAGGKALDVKQAADALGVGRQRVMDLINTGALPAVNVGGDGRQARYRIAPADLQHWWESRRVG